MNKLITIFLIGFIFGSCSSGEQKKSFEYYRFKKQLTPSGKYVIYDYARYGSMSFSSDILGTEVFDADDAFEEREGESINGSISEWISDDTLLVYNFRPDQNQPKDTLPIKTEYQNIGDFIVKSVFYKANSWGSDILNFDSVSTTKDSITIRVVSEKRQRLMSFPLGGTSIQVKSDSIIHIEVSTRLHKSMDFVYKNPDGTFTTNLPHIGTTSYDLRPIRRISPSLVPKKKVFWEK